MSLVRKSLSFSTWQKSACRFISLVGESEMEILMSFLPLFIISLRRTYFTYIWPSRPLPVRCVGTLSGLIMDDNTEPL